MPSEQDDKETITLRDLKTAFLEAHETLKNVRTFYVIPSKEWQAKFELREGRITYRKGE